MTETPQMRPITEVAEDLGLDPKRVLPYGRDKAKIDLGALEDGPGKGRLVLVSAMTPTRTGEGKTTMSVGLAMGLARLGERAVVCLREPSLGPVFGIKGGGTGGGEAQVEPAAEINLHFTGDLHAIGAAHNLLAAMVDNELHFGGDTDLDPRTVTWPRVVDMNDRALRNVIVGLGGRTGGVPRQTRFDITAASEVMAILGLAADEADLQARLARIVVGKNRDDGSVTAGDLGADGAMTALLRDALRPNLVQTREGSPALVHGGPFANIAHGCSSVVATRVGMRHADIVITEAGFGFDLGGEKFLDIKCRAAGIWPELVVIVTTVRALQAHGDGEISAGLCNLDQHLDAAEGFGLRAVVAINVFADDRDEELALITKHCEARGVRAAHCQAFAKGGEGALELAWAVRETMAPGEARYLYDLDAPYADKIEAVAKAMYGAEGVDIERPAARVFANLEREGRHLPICIAKTPLSLSQDTKLKGRPSGFRISVRGASLSAGAGFVVVLVGDVMTMPGLPRDPAAKHVRIEDGVVRGLMQNE